MADIIIEKIYKELLLIWGATILTGDSDARAAYLKAAKAADMGDYSLLLAFAYS